MANSIRTVSYTHLDVYKRQAVVVTLVVTTAGAAAYVVGQGAIYYGLSQTAAEALMYLSLIHI